MDDIYRNPHWKRIQEYDQVKKNLRQLTSELEDKRYALKQENESVIIKVFLLGILVLSLFVAMFRWYCVSFEISLVVALVAYLALAYYYYVKIKSFAKKVKVINDLAYRISREEFHERIMWETIFASAKLSFRFSLRPCSEEENSPQGGKGSD